MREGIIAISDLYLTLILPAYNEVGRIAQTIAEVKAYLQRRGHSHEIIVAADGDDGTRELVAALAQRDPALKVIGSTARQGKGHGVRQAAMLARGRFVGYVDADNKTPIEELDRFVPWLDQGYEVVIGSRRHQEARIERPQRWYRRYGSRGFAVFMHAVVGLHDIADTQCGFKFFQRAVALDLFGRQRTQGYMFDVEILHLARRSGYRIVQVPVRWRDDADSRLQLVRGNLRNVLDIMRIRFSP